MVRKIGLLLLSAIVVFAFVSPADANVRRFGNIEANVPSGWTVEDADFQLTFTAPGDAAIVSIITDEMEEGLTIEEIAAEISDEVGGNSPSSVGDGMFEFFFYNEHGIQSYVLVNEIDGTGLYMTWVIAGTHPDMETLLSSIRWVD